MIEDKSTVNSGVHAGHGRCLLADPRVRLILFLFFLSRLAYYFLGVRFQTNLLDFNFQFIDLYLLKTRLLESLYYFHMQPPLMNLGLGFLVKLFPTHYGEAQHTVYMAIGATVSVLLYYVMTRLSVSPRLAAALIILFVTAPGCVLFENFPLYEYPMMGLLTVASVVLYRLVERPKVSVAFAFFFIMAALGWIRALYDAVYLSVIIIALWIYLPRARRAIVIGAVVPLTLVLLLYVKNYVVFGLFANSSWLGFNLATCTTHQLTDAEKQMLVSGGKASDIILVEPLSPLKEYGKFVGKAAPTGIPVLDQEVKSTGGVNYNNGTLMRVGPLYRTAALQILRYYPVAYVRSVAIAWFCYFLPSGDFFQFAPNRAAIPGIDRLYNRVLFGQFLETSRKDLRRMRGQGHVVSLVFYTGTFLIILLPLILIASAVYIIRAYRTGTMTRAQCALAGFMWLSIVHVMATANFLSSFENNRYRFPTDALYIALLGMLIQRVWEARSRRRANSGGSAGEA